MSVPVSFALRAAIGGISASTFGVSHPRVCSMLLAKPRSTLKSLADVDAQLKFQPMRLRKASRLSIGALDTQIMVVARARRCGSTALMLSAIEEQVGQPAS